MHTAVVESVAVSVFLYVLQSTFHLTDIFYSAVHVPRYYYSSIYMELGLALDLLMCNYSSAQRTSTLCSILLIFMHCARLNHSPHADSAPLVGAARGSAQRQNLVQLYLARYTSVPIITTCTCT